MVDREQAERFALALQRFQRADKSIGEADPSEVMPENVEEYLDARAEFQTEMAEAGEVR